MQEANLEAAFTALESGAITREQFNAMGIPVEWKDLPLPELKKKLGLEPINLRATTTDAVEKFTPVKLDPLISDEMVKKMRESQEKEQRHRREAAQLIRRDESFPGNIREAYAFAGLDFDYQPQPIHFNLHNFQRELKVWAEYNFPDNPPDSPIIGMGEEIGELFESLTGLIISNGKLNHAYLKQKQGIRGTREQHQAAIKDAVADIIVYLADFCNKTDINLTLTLAETWSKVRRRDWKNDKKTGGQGEQSAAQTERADGK
jgi:NTP pyrophosphatase (non-canonical NTP hydrolase)